MKKLYFLIPLLGMLLIFSNCSRKTTPDQSTSRSVYGTDKANAANSTSVAPAKKVKTPVPKVISVNDSAAKKSVDGRYFYDLEGHRYWRNNRDGKYYLFNKSMASDPDFKAP